MSKEDKVFRVKLKGEALLTCPRWNKGTAFTEAERIAFNLEGRMPFQVNSLDQQCQRAYDQLRSNPEPIMQNAFLQTLKAQNWVLYYALLTRHLRELHPIIYTPTEAEAIQRYSHLFRRSEGLYLSFPHMARMEQDYLDQTKNRDIDLIVVSDGEAILGIGDQGVGGIGISSAKAVIYTLIGGIDPSKTLCVTLDVGTDNEDLLKDPLYVGWQHKRVRGEDYDKFVDKFVQLIRKHDPHSLLHFEDFGVTNARRLLDIYRDKHAVFNDDVQGTGAVTLATIMSAIGLTPQPKLSQHKIVVFGAGSAGLGIARQIRDGMVLLDGVEKEEANKRFWLVDKQGLVTKPLVFTLDSNGGSRPGWEEFARDDWEDAGSANITSSANLAEVVDKIHPTILIGTSTRPGAFTEEIVKSMAKNCDRPIILPLSNPSKLIEVHPQDAMRWSEGRGLIATGSPFGEVDIGEGRGKCVIAECNNALIYPALGIGTIVCRSRKLTDAMLVAGTQALARLSPALNDKKAADPANANATTPALLPDLADAPSVSVEVAVAVAEQAIKDGVADENLGWGLEDVRAKVEAIRWEPVYGTYVYDPEGDD